MGGGGQKSVTTTQGSDPRVVPQLEPFVRRVGQEAERAVGFPELSMQRFAAPYVQPIAGLSPLEQIATERMAQRGIFGIPVSAPEQMAFGQFSQFGSPGNLQQSPAIQSALQGLESEIIPAVQNQAALSGLAQSGFLPQEVGRAYARELVPLFQQGLTQQMEAAQQLSGLGQREDERQVQSLRELMAGGETMRGVEQARSQAQLDDILRVRELALGLVNPFGSFGVVSGIPSEQRTKSSGGGLSFGK